MKNVIISLVLAVASIFIVGCSDADIASQNISNAADQFEIYRRVVFYNGITDKYILEIDGYCSIEDDGSLLKVTVKTGPGTYLKHYLGKSDNVTFFAEQLEPANVSVKQYRVIFKPEVIVPNVQVK